MLFFSFFKTLTNHTVTIELKNDIRIRGTLKSVDQYLNIKLDDIEVLDLDQYPHLSSVKNIFVRGSVVRYVVLPQAEVDRGLLEDATRRVSSRAVSFLSLVFNPPGFKGSLHTRIICECIDPTGLPPRLKQQIKQTRLDKSIK
ncbi:small nuclear ribonucleoprotein LSM2 [Paracoccidioides lutzii Pb01]|uniref:Small nuclear ribonucleoprotein LSM2 n=1 Tax=Paracoccidioides lutzii (strain ATCC MYA-826 / Pb01) TaxID=502779 RepID=C1GSY5_PARBA|nr:small nuclear ribonucleoprotein LSM2 [Paracoccidioides lutzii Pb01]EEH39168.2 small nuclear ribonucleoprotein LSM2 [Paracoccidioides lutzii Pb01]